MERGFYFRAIVCSSHPNKSAKGTEVILGGRATTPNIPWRIAVPNGGVHDWMRYGSAADGICPSTSVRPPAPSSVRRMCDFII